MPGPSFTRPPVTDTGEQARREAFEMLAARRDRELRRDADARGLLGDAPSQLREQAHLLGAFVREFVDAVERANSSRALLRQQPLDYVDAVLLDGTDGQLVVDAVEYDGAEVHWQARVGGIERIVHGADLDAYLRTGETRYAERIGLA